MASQPDIRTLVLNAHIPPYLYHFLNTVSKTQPCECILLISLGVIGALIKVEDTYVINFLPSTETILLCLRAMEEEPRIGGLMPRFCSCSGSVISP